MLKNTVIPATITKVTKNHHDPYARIRGLKVVTPSLIQGTIDENAIPRDAEYVQGQVVQAVVLSCNRHVCCGVEFEKGRYFACDERRCGA